MKTKIKIEGTHCKACKSLIEDVCSEIPGVMLCDVNFEDGMAIVEHADSIDWDNFRKVIEGLGDQYKVKI